MKSVLSPIDLSESHYYGSQEEFDRTLNISITQIQAFGSLYFLLWSYSAGTENMLGGLNKWRVLVKYGV